MVDVRQGPRCAAEGRRTQRKCAWPGPLTGRSCGAAGFVAAIERRQGLRIGCLEEISYINKWIDEDGLRRCANSMTSSDYGDYVRMLIRETEGE